MRAAKPWCVLRQAQDEAIFFVAPTLDGRKGGPHPEPVEGRNPADPAPPINSHARKPGSRAAARRLPPASAGAGSGSPLLSLSKGAGTTTKWFDPLGACASATASERASAETSCPHPTRAWPIARLRCPT